MRLRFSLYRVLAFLATLVAPAQSFGLTFVVDRFDDEPAATGCSPFTANDCSLRGAVLHANTTAAADQVLLPNGTYQLTVPGAVEDLAATGDLDVTEDLTVHAGLNASPKIVQTAGDRIFHVLGGASSFGLEGPLTLQGGFGTNGMGLGPGGSIYVANGSSLSLTNVVLTGASSENAGGCLNYSGGMFGQVLTLTDVTVSGCSAGGVGGGINISSDTPQVLLERVVVEGCHAVGIGGGLAIQHVDDLAIVRDSILRGNSAGDESHQGSAGGLLVDFGADVRLDGTSVVGNRAGVEGNLNGGHGAGIVVSSSALELRNSTLSGNRIYGGYFAGAAIQVVSSSLDLDHATVVDNEPVPEQVGPSFRPIFLLDAVLEAEASIVEGGCYEFFSSTMTSHGFNVERPTDGSMVTECDLTDPSDVLTAATVVRPLAGNGGPTPTHALAPGSPAELLVPSGTCAAEDQRHAPRSLLFCDAGSYETSGTPPGPWIFADGYESGDAFAWSDETP